jgi:hypothetical protein
MCRILFGIRNPSDAPSFDSELDAIDRRHSPPWEDLSRVRCGGTPVVNLGGVTPTDL